MGLNAQNQISFHQQANKFDYVENNQFDKSLNPNSLRSVQKYTKVAANGQNQDVMGVKPNGNKIKVELSKLEKAISSRTRIYSLRNETQKILRNRHLVCGNLPIADTVKIGKSNTGKLIYSDLAACGLGWACPVCAVKLSSGKADNVQEILKNAKKDGKQIYFATLTTKHTKYDPLERLIDLTKENYRRATGHRRYKDFRKKYGIFAYIKAFEITYGLNGWHPHLHIAYVLDKKTDLEKFKDDLFKLWAYFQEKEGVKISKKGFDVKQMNEINLAEYISKWQLSAELTQASLKKSNSNETHKTKNIFNIVEQKVNNYVYIYKDYVQFTKGLQAVYIHPKLKKYGVIRSDEEIIKDESKILEILMNLDRKIWHVIRHHKLQLKVINEFERYGIDGIISVLLDYVEFVDYKEKGLFLTIENRHYLRFVRRQKLTLTDGFKYKMNTKIDETKEIKRNTDKLKMNLTKNNYLSPAQLKEIKEQKKKDLTYYQTIINYEKNDYPTIKKPPE